MDDIARAERLIAAAFRGLMEGLIGAPTPQRQGRTPRRQRTAEEPNDAPAQEEFTYPQAPDLVITPTAGPDEAQMLAALKQAWRETEPIVPNMDLAQVQAAQQTRYNAEMHRMTPQTQPGPGEDETRAWLGIET